MNAYLLLENGISLDLAHEGSTNLVGKLVKTNEGRFCFMAGVSQDPSQGIDPYEVSQCSVDLNKWISPDQSMRAKLVVDKLPLDYHLSDLKNAF